MKGSREVWVWVNMMVGVCVPCSNSRAVHPAVGGVTMWLFPLTQSTCSSDPWRQLTPSRHVMGVLPTNPAMHLQARRAEEERARAEAEEAARLEEEERLRAEERERKKAAAKAKKEELKRQGKLLTGGRQGWGGSRGWGCMHEAAKDLGVPGVHGAILD